MNVIAALGLLTMLVAVEPLHAQEGRPPTRPSDSATSCNEFLPAPTRIADKNIGPEDCRIVSEEIVFNLNGQRFRRRELRLSGTVEGWAARQGPRSNYFSDGPDFVLAGNSSSRFKAIGRYSGSTGHGATLFLPEDPAHWNGKLFMTAHGAGPYAGIGALRPRDPNADFNPLTNANRYIGLMLDRGYAVAHTLRSSHLQGGDIVLTLEDGTTLEKYNLSSHGGFMIGTTKMVERMVVKQLGRRPTRTYFYGFSAGGFLGQLIQYQPGLNQGDGGKPVFDGFLIDDAGGGGWRPVLVVDGKDTLFLSDGDKKRFVPQIDIAHQLYEGEAKDYLQKKREHARILTQKGLASKHRMYEIAGVSHFDAGQVSLPHLVSQTLDLGGLLESLIDILDKWVEHGAEPPATKSDVPELGGPALALPEVACPLGVYYAYPAAQGNPRRAGQETGFAAFDGIDLEPFDGRGELVDMNGNGVRDRRETVADAWERRRLLKPGERFTQGAYAACVARAAAALVAEGLLPPRLLAYYVKQAVASRIVEGGR